MGPMDCIQYTNSRTVFVSRTFNIKNTKKLREEMLAETSSKGEGFKKNKITSC